MDHWSLPLQAPESSVLRADTRALEHQAAQGGVAADGRAAVCLAALDSDPVRPQLSLGVRRHRSSEQGWRSTRSSCSRTTSSFTCRTRPRRATSPSAGRRTPDAGRAHAPPALAPGTIGVGTARNMTVPVEVEVLDRPPGGEDLRAWDQVHECAIDLPSGRLFVAGCTDSVPDAARIEGSRAGPGRTASGSTTPGSAH
jgi:hypothetical protein